MKDIIKLRENFKRNLLKEDAWKNVAKDMIEDVVADNLGGHDDKVVRKMSKYVSSLANALKQSGIDVQDIDVQQFAIGDEDYIKKLAKKYPKIKKASNILEKIFDALDDYID